jgi:hypothetical protein
VANSDNRIAPTDEPASGRVCSGWNTLVDDLNTLGLQAEVLRRLNAFTSPADKAVYVVGHSREGALVGDITHGIRPAGLKTRGAVVMMVVLWPRGCRFDSEPWHVLPYIQGYSR